MLNSVCKCCHNRHPDPYPKQIPTFVHEPIFDSMNYRSSRVRYTPTFHSTVFDLIDYDKLNNQKNLRKTQKQCQNVKCQEKPVRPSSVCHGTSYENETSHKRQVDLNPHTHICHGTQQGWFDNKKGEILKDWTVSQTQCLHHGLSRERKLL